MGQNKKKQQQKHQKKKNNQKKSQPNNIIKKPDFFWLEQSIKIFYIFLNYLYGIIKSPQKPEKNKYERNNAATYNSKTNQKQNKKAKRKENKKQKKQTQPNVEKEQIKPTSSRNTQQMKNKEKSLPQILLVGKAGVGKTSLYNKLDSQKSQGNGFQTVTLEDFVVVDTPSFELEDDVEIRDQKISEFQKYLIANQNNVSIFAVVVNFERTDLMKQKVMSVYKYLRKFAQQIVIIVTNWELSENKPENESQLQESLKIFKCKIKFVESELKKSKLIRLLRGLINNQNTQIDLKDTIFEVYDENSSEFQENMRKVVESVEKQNALRNRPKGAKK